MEHSWGADVNLIPQQDILNIVWASGQPRLPEAIQSALEDYPPVKIISMTEPVSNNAVWSVMLIVETV